MDKEKVTAMLSWPVTRNLKEFWGFLRLTGYYRKFVQQYALIARLFIEQLKKDAFGWTEEAMAAFQILKQPLC